VEGAVTGTKIEFDTSKCPTVEIKLCNCLLWSSPAHFDQVFCNAKSLS